jgi:processive 1,2-diacylglycerol beta-glucosyltransferase
LKLGGHALKVLFLSNTAGQGHRSTADAVMNMLLEMGAECRILDSYAYINPVLYQAIAQGYLLATSITPTAYGGFYRLYEKRDKNDSKYSFINVASSIMAIKLKKFFKTEFNPDVIVCTHIFSAQIVNIMKANGQLDAVTIGIITDYTIHPFWQDASSIDYFVTASELLTRQAVKKGISEDKLLPLGIPINPKFSSKIDKLEARRTLGIDPDKFTILLMSGSMGHGNITKVLTNIDNLENDFQVLIVCGNNLHAKRKIEKLKTKKKVYSYGYVNNVELMMDAADCIVTKPGGLTSSEALAKNLPIVMINPIPGQEDRNVEFMLNNGLALNVTKTFPVDEAFYQLLIYPEKLKNMTANIKLVGKPNATRDLCNFIMQLKK